MKSIGELQYEYLEELLSLSAYKNKRMTVSQAIHRMNVLNQYVAYYSVMRS